MTEPKTQILQIPLKGAILKAFDFAFQNSGFESRTEYVRSLIMNDYNNVIVHHTPYGSENGSYEINESQIKDGENNE